MEAKAGEIRSAFHDFWSIWAQRKTKRQTIQELILLLDEHVTAIGTGEHEEGHSYEQVVQNFKDDFNEIETPIALSFSYENVKVLAPTAGLVEAKATISIPIQDDEPLNLDLRFSTVFVYKNDKWVLTHNHVSVPSDGQSEGQAYPIDKLKAINERLQRQVEERTKKIEESKKQLEKEKARTELLLYNILPKVVAKELLSTGKTMPARHENTSVLFTDFVQFTQLAKNITARKLVAELNEIFYIFDDIVKAEKLEKIKTIGDSYMAVCGLPEANDDHALQCITAAQKMIAFLNERNEKNDLTWKMRVGIHSGPVVAGVVGNHKFTYDLWGNTVNLASRLEGSGKAGMINISEQTYELIKEQVNCDYRGKIKVKGAHEMGMYFVCN